MSTLAHLRQHAEALREKLSVIARRLESLRLEAGFASRAKPAHRRPLDVLHSMVRAEVEAFQNTASDLHAVEARIEAAEARQASPFFYPLTISEEARRALRESSISDGPITFGFSGTRAPARIPA